MRFIAAAQQRIENIPTSWRGYSYLLLGILLLLIALRWHFAPVNIVGGESLAAPSPEAEEIADASLPQQLHLPSLDQTLQIDPGAIVTSTTWEVSRQGATFLTSSAVPGSYGNTVLYGHNWRGIFGSLDKITAGDTVTVTTESGSEFNYRVTEKFVVPPTEVQILDQSRTNTLTIFTCTGFFNKDRLVVRAELVE